MKEQVISTASSAAPRIISGQSPGSRLQGMHFSPRSDPASAAGTTRSRFLEVQLPPLLVLLAAACMAWIAYTRFLEAPRQLWSSGAHDRNAHYLLGLNVALDLRKGDVMQLLHDLDGTRVWGPLHGVVLGSILAVFGLDYRFAVFPSLIAWVATVLLAFLTARRVVPRGGNFAGAVAAIFVMASPAYRAFATDIMLESSGACLTLLVLYLYVVTKQSVSVGAARGLGLALTALFLLKYNYWLLALAPLVLVELLAIGRSGIRTLVRGVADLPWRTWLRAQVRHPLNYLFAISVVLWGCVQFSHGESVKIGGHTILLRSADNLVSLAYVVLFLRALPWWWRQGCQWARQLPYPIPQLLAWHALPMALWFLVPKRPSYFFWYLTRNHGDEVEQHSLFAAASYYWHCLVADYQMGLVSVLLAVALIGVALAAWRSLRPGGIAVLVFMLLAALLAVRYPSHRSRFLNSWLASAWVVAGIGLCQLAYGPLTHRLGNWRHTLAAAMLMAMAGFHFSAMEQPGHAPEGGPDPQFTSTLDISDDYLPVLADARRPAVLSNSPIKQFTNWPYLQEYGRRAPIECELPKPAPGASFGDMFEHWLKKSQTDVIVYIDVQPGSRVFGEPERTTFHEIPELLAAQTEFHVVQRNSLPNLGCTVTVWRR